MVLSTYTTLCHTYIVVQFHVISVVENETTLPFL